MSSKREPLVTGEYYHIYNRGVDKRDIFNDVSDLERFKESIKEFNQIDTIGSLQQLRALSPKSLEEMMIGREPLVAIVAFTLNPNHFHFLLKQLVDGGIAKFMQKLSGGYTSYFNDKDGRSGSLFQGTFKSKLADDAYFKKIFPYVNQNYLVHDIPEDKLNLVFSSNQEYDSEVFDFISEVEGQFVLNMFNNKNEYKNHCKEIINIIREKRGKISLFDPDELP